MLYKKLILIFCMYLSILSAPYAHAFDYSFSRADIDVYDSFDEVEKFDFKRNLIAAEWREISQGYDSGWYINYKYIKPTYDDFVEVWVKKIITKDVVKDGLGVGDYSMTRLSLNCSSEKSKYLSFILYNHKTNTVIDSIYYSDYETSYKAIAPETHLSNVLEEACFIAHVKSN